MKTFVRALLLLVLSGRLALGNVSIYQPLAVPKAEDVVLFSNGLAPATGVRIYKKKQDILRLLRHGKNNLDVSLWYAIEQARQPKTMTYCDGVFTDKAGTIYFWEMFGNDVLKLQTADGRYAFIQLGKK